MTNLKNKLLQVPAAALWRLCKYLYDNGIAQYKKPWHIVI